MAKYQDQGNYKSTKEAFNWVRVFRALDSMIAKQRHGRDN